MLRVVESWVRCGNPPNEGPCCSRCSEQESTWAMGTMGVMGMIGTVSASWLNAAPPHRAKRGPLISRGWCFIELGFEDTCPQDDSKPTPAMPQPHRCAPLTPSPAPFYLF